MNGCGFQDHDLKNTLSSKDVVLHAVSVYKKRLYKKRPVEFLLDKKRRLVDFHLAKKRVSYSYSKKLLI